MKKENIIAPFGVGNGVLHITPRLYSGDSG